MNKSADPVHEVSLTQLIEHCGIHPLNDPPWGIDGPIYLTEIHECIEDKRLRDKPVALPRSFNTVLHTGLSAAEVATLRKEHIERIAYLVVNPADDPIIIDVGIPGMLDCFHIEDGFHRMAAALFRHKETVQVSFSGSIEHFGSLFPDAKQVA